MKRNPNFFIFWILILVILVLAEGYAFYFFYNSITIAKYDREYMSSAIENQTERISSIEAELALLRERSEILEERLDIENNELRDKLQVEVAKREQLARAQADFTDINLTELISDWRENVVYIECDFDEYISSGSGFVTNTDALESSGVGVITNSHVITGDYGEVPNYCFVDFPGDEKMYVADKESGQLGVSNTDLDFGILKLDKPTATLTTLASRDINICTDRASIGDKIVIIGYPSIGARGDITATEGIISGYDGNYYITSAKVEQGNSGGAAVHVENNCYLGIPTFVQAGIIESLARILDARNLGL